MKLAILGIAVAEAVGLIFIPFLAKTDMELHGEGSRQAYIMQCLWEFGIFNLGLLLGAVMWY